MTNGKPLRSPYPWFGIVGNKPREYNDGMNETTFVKFWIKVNKNGPIPTHNPALGACWMWTASLRSKGYGAFSYTMNGRLIQDRAHRFSFLLHGGRLEKGQCVLHRCDTPACVNPAHLFAGTKADNNDDMRRKGRSVAGGTKTPKMECKYERGEGHHAAKLTADIVRKIRKDRAGGMSFSGLGKKYKLAIGHVFRIVNRKAWAHVE